MARTTAVATVVALGALLTWQLGDAPNLQRSTLAQRAASEVQQLFEEMPDAQLVEVDTRFSRASVPGQNTLLVSAYAQPARGSADRSALGDQLQRSIAAAIRDRIPDVTPLVDVTVLSPPAAAREERG